MKNNPTKTASVDIVTVPDFSGKRRDEFTIRTLFFLASWKEYAQPNDSFPLHLACIGEPPLSVRKLAEICKAEITVHEPVSVGISNYFNKLRGLEISQKTENLLLLDSDILVLSPIYTLFDMIPNWNISSSWISAASASVMTNPPQEYWHEIYTGLGLNIPIEPFTCLLDELRSKYWEKSEKLYPGSFPNYNSGVLLLKGDMPLFTYWKSHTKRIIKTYLRLRVSKAQLLKLYDQLPLATTIQALIEQGIEFKTLPNSFNTRYLHIYFREIKLLEASFLHLKEFPRPLNKDYEAYPEIIEEFKTYLRKRFYSRWIATPPRLRSSEFFRCLLPAWRDVYRLGKILDSLYTKHIQPIE